MLNTPSRSSQPAHLPNASQTRAAPALARGRLRWALWRRVPDQAVRYAAGVTAALALSTGLLVACGGGAESTPLASTGFLRVALTDAPACGYEAVFVTVREVRAHKSLTAIEGDAGWATIALPSPRRIDLLTLTNGALDELGQAPLEAGRYTQMRLVLADNTAATPLASESAALEAVVSAQAQVQAAADVLRRMPVSHEAVADLGKADAVLAAVLVRLVALVEQQSALQADPQVTEPLRTLRELPPRLTFARQMFNEAGAAYNAATTQFPTRLLGSLMRFGQAGRL